MSSLFILPYFHFHFMCVSHMNHLWRFIALTLLKLKHAQLINKTKLKGKLKKEKA